MCLMWPLENKGPGKPKPLYFQSIGTCPSLPHCLFFGCPILLLSPPASESAGPGKRCQGQAHLSWEGNLEVGERADIV